MFTPYRDMQKMANVPICTKIAAIPGIQNGRSRAKECGFESHPRYPKEKPQNMPISAILELYYTSWLTRHPSRLSILQDLARKCKSHGNYSGTFVP